VQGLTKTVEKVAGAKILCVCQEIFPYLPESPIATTCRTLSQAMQERGFEIRTFMPRFGCINERRNQLHEVIRLSGMNLIINDNDHQLIIKVASIPAARVQIYFIDNDEYFSPRKATFRGADGVEFEDNDQRAIFFSRGVLETVKKLRWQPDIIHCHSWFTAAAPLYLRNCFTDEPLFSSAKIVFSIYDDTFDGVWGENFRQTMMGEGVPADKLPEGDITYEKLVRLVIDNADGIVVEAEQLPAAVEEYLATSGKRVLRPTGEPASDERLQQYKEFYDSIL
jgi:starch synthase